MSYLLLAVSSNLQKYIDSLTTLATLATSLQNDTSPLNVTLNGVTYGVNQSTLNVTGTMQCDQGSFLNYGLCSEFILLQYVIKELLS